MNENDGNTTAKMLKLENRATNWGWALKCEVILPPCGPRLGTGVGGWFCSQIAERTTVWECCPSQQRVSKDCSPHPPPDLCFQWADRVGREMAHRKRGWILRNFHYFSHVAGGISWNAKSKNPILVIFRISFCTTNTTTTWDITK